MLGQPPASVAPEVWAKLDPALRQALRSLNADPSVALPVVISLVGQPDTSRSRASPDLPRPTPQERSRAAQEREAAFAAELADLISELHGYGATDVQPFSLNRTVGARVTLPGLEAVARRPETKQILLAVRRPVTA
jgi:hypothetical protein